MTVDLSRECQTIKDLLARFQFNEAFSRMKSIQDSLGILDPNNPDDLHIMFSCYECKGITYYYLKDYEPAKQAFENLANLARTHNSTDHLIEALSYIGWIHAYLGEYERALSFFYDTIELIPNLQNAFLEIRPLMGIGIVNMWQGELSRSLPYMNKCLNIIGSRKMENQDTLAKLYNAKGTIYYTMGEIDKAIDMFNSTLALDHSKLNGYNLAVALFHLILIYVDKENKELTDKYLALMDSAVQRSESQVVYYGRRFIEAYMYLKHPRYHVKFKAHAILYEIIDGDYWMMELKVLAMKKLTELLIIEFQATENPEVYQEIDEMINKILDIAASQSSYMLLVEMYILKSKLLIADNKVKEASVLIDGVIAMAREKGLPSLLEVIEEEKEHMADLVSKLYKLGKDATTVHQRIEHTKLLSYLEELRSIVMN